MSEKTVKPTLEMVARQQLGEGEALDILLDFDSFLKLNNLKATTTSSQVWGVTYKGKRICRLKLMRENYWIFTLSMYKSFADTPEYISYISDEQKEFLLAHFRPRTPCNGCKGTGEIEFLGNEYETYCGCYPIYTNSNQLHENPGLLEQFEELVLVSKKMLDDIAAAKKMGKSK